MLTANSDFGGTFYIRRSSGSFAAYSITGGGANHPNASWNGEIQMGQSFWVVSGASSTDLNLTESMKIAEGNGQFLRRADEINSSLRVKLVSENQSDETIITFNENATENFEHSYDAYKFFNGYTDINDVYHPYVNLSSFNDSAPNTNYVFNTLPSSECSTQVNLNIGNVTEGEHSLEFSGLDDFTLPYKITLIDNFEGVTQIISQGDVYEFDVTADAASYGTNRFDVTFEAVEIDESIVPSYSSVDDCDVSYVTFNLTGAQNGIDYFLMSGDIVVDSVRASSTNIDLLVVKQFLVEGENVFSVKAKNAFACTIGQVDYENLITFNNIIVPEITGVTGASNCPGNAVVLSANGAPDDGYYLWYESADATQPIAGENANIINTGELQENKTFYVSAVNVNGCEGSRVAVTAEIASLIPPVVTSSKSCEASTFDLEASGAPDGGIYKWYTASDAESPIFESVEGGFTTELIENSTQFFVSVVTQNGCESKRVSVVAEVINLEEPEILVQGLILTAPEAADSYQWFKDGEPLNDATQSTYEVNATGTYTVEVTIGACSVRSNGKTFNITGIDDELYHLGLNVYPNPVSDYLTIRSTNRLDFESLKFEFFDLKGNKVVSEQDFSKFELKYSVNMSSLESGVYIMNIQKDNEYISLKILKQ